ncbi:MAG TPA: hypothetical protein V6C86_24150 [Oculatellaceae cyanobacterium]
MHERQKVDEQGFAAELDELIGKDDFELDTSTQLAPETFDPLKDEDEADKAIKRADADESNKPEAEESAPLSQAEKDRQDTLEQINRKYDVMNGMITQLMARQSQPQTRQHAPQPVHQLQPQQAQEDYLLTANGFAQSQYAQQLQHMQRVQVHMLAENEKANFQAAEAAMRAKYKDFDDLVKPQEREIALQSMLKQGRFGGNNWLERFELGYQHMDYPRLKAQADELQRKRDEKNAQAVKAASRVPASGQPYQKPAPPKLDRTKRGYAEADAAMLAELAAAM